MHLQDIHFEVTDWAGVETTEHKGEVADGVEPHRSFTATGGGGVALEEGVLGPVSRAAVGRRQNLLGRFWQIPRFQKREKPLQDLLDAIGRESSDLLDQILLVERINLGHVHDAALRQIRLPDLQKHVPRSFSQVHPVVAKKEPQRGSGV